MALGMRAKKAHDIAFTPYQDSTMTSRLDYANASPDGLSLIHI